MPDWLSYDSVADTYERVAVPWFTSLARAVVSALDLRTGERLIDVGTGTGLALREAVRVEPSLTVVGVDPSLGMLRRLPVRDVPGLSRVAAMSPGLPFAAASFDAAAANLSVSHLPDLDAGVGDIARVLRAGGRLACSAWASTEPEGDDNQRSEADAIVDRIRDKHGLDSRPPIEAAPWEDKLRGRDAFAGVLVDAGFVSVDVSEHLAAWTFTVDEFLSGWGSRGRYLRHVAGPERWRAFVEATTEALHDRFGDRIEVVSTAWIAVAHRGRSARPGDT